MAVHNPHLLSYKLCRLFDSGLSDVDTFAKECDLSPKQIEALARTELPISIETKHRIGRVLSYYYRKHPELYRDQSPASKRGVVEVPLRTRDWRGFEVTDSRGKCIMYAEYPTKECTQARIDFLWELLDRDDPHQLKVI